MNKKLAQLLKISAAVAGIAAGLPAHAGLISFTSQAAWNAAVGPVSGTENFNSFASDTTFQNTTVNVNNMSISGVPGSNGSTTNTIDALSFAYGGYYDLNGSTYLLGDLQGSQTIRIDFTDAVSAWGGTFSGISDGPRNTVLSAYDAGNNLLGVVNTSSVTNSDVGFYGFAFDANETASYLVFQNTTTYNDVFGLDDIGFVTANVPEPNSLALFGLGLVGLTLLRRKKQA